MSEEIKISVIIPVYNVEKYLKECVDSVLNQTYKNIEVILVDDGSPDNCPRICDDYANSDDRIKVLHKTNGGLSSARNVGLEIMDGDYFIFLDSDDYWNDKEFLKKLISDNISNNPDIVVLGYKKYYVEKSRFVEGYSTDISLNGNDKTTQIKQLIENNIFESNAWTKVISKRMFCYDLRFIEGIYSEDIDWSARLLIYAKSLDVNNGNVYVYRQNNSSITHNLNRKNIMDLKNQIIRIVELSKQIEQEDYYEWYMNYCAYQYVTFLNCAVAIDKSENISEFVNEMKEYAYLLNYHVNKKVNLVYKFYKLLGYKGMLKILKLFLKIRG